MDKEVLVSKDGLEKLKTELSEIENSKLKDVAKMIAEAKDMGDLSENAEYHEAKQQQAFLFGRAQELRYKIKNARVIEKSNLGVITAGSFVDVKNGSESLTFDIVGSEEADPLNGKISVDSPIGSALMGKKVGDIVSVSTPAGESEYEIIRIK